MGWKIVDSVKLIQARDQWRVSVNRLKSPRFHNVLQTSGQAEKILASQ
jgi:hypothetical protein